MSKTKFKRNTRTSREMRRIGEQEQRREQRHHAMQAYWKLPKEERVQRLADNAMVQRIQRNGITLEDLKAAEDRAMQDGYLAGKIETLKLCYAGMCLALHEKYGFGLKRCKDALNAVDEKIVYALTSEELVDEVFASVGLEIDFKDAFPGERVSEKGA